MRVYHIADSYLTETFIFNYVVASAAIADEVIVVAFSEPTKLEFQLPDNVKIFSVDNYYYKRRSLKGLLRFFVEKSIGEPLWFRQLDSIFEKYPPDFIHCHFGPVGVLMSRFSKRRKLPLNIAVSFYGYDASSLPAESQKYREDLNELWKAANLILAEGPAMREKIIGLGAPAEKVKLNRIIIDHTRYPKYKKYRLASNEVSFLLIGRFREKKGFHLFLDAIGKMGASLGDYTITMVGDGPMKETYESIIKKYKIESRVKFAGALPLSACINLMLEHDVFVHPSLTAKDGDSEGGAPTILLEAQVVGIPIIASTHADIPFVMGYDDFLARENDVDDLIRVIQKFLQARPEDINRFVESGRELVVKNHSFLSPFYGKLIKP